MPGEGYLLGNANSAAGRRLDGLGELFDSWTLAHLEARGLGEGWRCWEVGAGGPGVPDALVDRVGASGHVVATDLDASHLGSCRAEVLELDVVDGPPPGAPFDLIHARLVLVHVTDRQRALEVMMASLAPGGWLVIEDADPALQPLACLDGASPEAELANRIRSGFRFLLAERGADLAFGRRVPGMLRAAGLVDVAADAFFPVVASACATLELETMAMIGHQLIDAGIVDAAELARHCDAVAAGALDLTQPPLVSSWGRAGDHQGEVGA